MRAVPIERLPRLSAFDVQLSLRRLKTVLELFSRLFHLRQFGLDRVYLFLHVADYLRSIVFHKDAANLDVRWFAPGESTDVLGRDFSCPFPIVFRLHVLSERVELLSYSVKFSALFHEFLWRYVQL